MDHDHPIHQLSTGLAGWTFGGPFTPHGHCYLWEPTLIWLHVISDAIIALAYYSIPLALIYFVRRRRDLAFNWMFVMFAVFIVCCGTTHLLSIVTVWDPLYYLDGTVKAVTAAASIGTAWALWPLLPKALAIPGPAQLHITNSQLASQIAVRERAEAELRSARELLEARVQERTAALAAANQELIRSNRDLEEFASIAAHDLKEPLRTISHHISIIKEDEAGTLSPAIDERLDAMSRVSERMDAIIESLLHYSRVGHAELSFEDTDLQLRVGDVLESLHGMLETHHVEIRIPSRLPVVRCDRVRAVEVFRNLVVNAIKYNDKPERWIEIGVAPPSGPPTGQLPPGAVDHRPIFYVRDNGIGIPQKHFQTIFRMFKRLHARDKYGGGVGAGLAIAKAIVERHGGRIWVESEPGIGTTFFFTLGPAREAPVQQPAADRRG